MAEIFILLINLIIILYFVGYGFSSIFLPEKLRKDAFFIIPWLGVVLITFLSVALTMARIPISQGKYIIFGISFSFGYLKVLFHCENLVLPLVS